MSILNTIKKKASKEHRLLIGVKVEESLHSEVAKLLAERGMTWQEMLHASVVVFVQECKEERHAKAR